MLYLKKGKRKQKAKKDIICYRLLILNNDSRFLDLKGCAEDNPDIIYWANIKSDLFFKQNGWRNNGEHLGERIVLGGYKSFDTLETLKKFWYHMVPLELGHEPGHLGLVAVKCTIPKGAEYYEGTHDSNCFNGYVSKNIQMNEIVEYLNN